MRNFDETKFYEGHIYKEDDIYEILTNISNIIEEKGYNSVNQIMGYIKTGDPIYIPRDNQLREKIRYIDIDDILKYLLRFFIERK